MTTTASNAWMPPGRHDIIVGSSLTRALKARKSGPVQTRLKPKPDRELYSFRYNFKPESVDSTKPGSIAIQAKEDGQGSSVNVVRPSTQNEHGVNYVGSENLAREFECVLIWDEETGTVTLEKVESNVVLTHDHKRVHVARHAGSPVPSASPRISASSSSSSAQPPRQITARREEEESEGEIPESKPKPPPRPTASTAQSKSKQPVPIPIPAPLPPPVATPPSVPRPAHVLPVKPVPVPVSSKAKGKALSAPPPLPSVPNKALPKGANKRELLVPTNVEEETLEIRRPVQPPAKRARIASEKKVQQQQPPPPPPKPVALSFPDSSSLVSLPPPLPTTAFSEPVTSVPSDSEEDEWDPVPPITASEPPAALPTRTIVMEEIEPSAFTPPPHAAELSQALPSAEDNEGEEIDMDAFEAELNGELGGPVLEPDAIDEDEDFPVYAVSPVDFGFGDDDEYSSSDDSDDD